MHTINIPYIHFPAKRVRDERPKFITGIIASIKKGNEINIESRRSKRTPIQKARMMLDELTSPAEFENVKKKTIRNKINRSHDNPTTPNR